MPLGTVKSRISTGVAQLQDLLVKPEAHAQRRSFVTIQKAKEILLAYRAGTSDREDPEVREALAATGRDNELRAWFETQQQLQQQIRRDLRVACTRGVARPVFWHRDKIVPLWSGPKHCWRWRRWQFLRPACCFACGPMMSVARLASFRSRMAGEVLRVYSMDIITNNPAGVRSISLKKALRQIFRCPQCWKIFRY